MDASQMCCNLYPFLRAINIVLIILKWSVPLLLVVLGTIDMVRAAASADEKVVKEAQTTFMKRLLYGVVIFIIPFLVNMVLFIAENFLVSDNMELTNATSWISCWNDIVKDEALTCTEDIYN